MKKLAFLLCLISGVALGQPSAPTSFTASVSPAYLSIAGLHVVGNQILNSSGQAVRLRGVNVNGAAYECQTGAQVFDGPSDQTMINALLAWGINVVRIPVNEVCWLGINGYPYTGLTAAQYQTAITNYINLLNSNGIAAILDLQFTTTGGTGAASNNQPMPDAGHASAFWASAAAVYASNSSVIFDLFNEPWPDNNNDSTAAWTCVKNGGTCSGVSFTTVGMQSLLNTVRSAGANNIVMVPGVQYENTLDQWLAYEPTDTLSPAQIMASWHSYTNEVCSAQSCWNTNILPVLAQVPLIAGEIGETDCGTTFVNELMDWLDAFGGNYTAWGWYGYANACTSWPALVSDFSGTPTNYGIGVRNHLLNVTGQYPPAQAPVTYFATSFPVGIGVGRSTNYTASDGTVYYPDVGNSNAGLTTSFPGPYSPFTTADTITGTSDPTLYQTGREGPAGAYWYINVPNGTYQVTLGLAYNSTYFLTGTIPTGPYGQDQLINGQDLANQGFGCYSSSFSGTDSYVDTLGGITGGSGYTNGTFSGVALSGGTGTGAVGTIYVVGGVVTKLVVTAGTGYVTGDVLTAPSLAGGSGFHATVQGINACPGPGLANQFIPAVDTAYTVTYTVPVYEQQIAVEVGASFGGGRLSILNSIKIAFSAPSSPPATPVGFGGVVSGGHVNLSWTASAGAQYYKILRATSTLGAYEPIAAPEGASYSDTAVVTGTTYCYYIAALSGAGSSANSSQVCATP